MRRPFSAPRATVAKSTRGFCQRSLNGRVGFIVLVHEAGGRIDGFIVARFGSAPPPFGQGSLFHVDDFALADATSWPTVGRALLSEVIRRAQRAGIQTGIVVTGPASVDEPKAAFLAGFGMRVEAEWRVKPLAPASGEKPAKEGFDAAIGPAPPVYDPGGLTALALRIDYPEAVGRFEKFAAASEAVVAIVPLRTSDERLRAELDRRGFVVGSEWYAGPVSSLTST
jgi:GNAT superfamily N-acetyltransferase